MAEMASRERMRRALTGELPDRIPLCEICIWPETIQRWRTEGLPEDVDALDWLGMDKIAMYGADCSLRFPEQILEEDAETRLVRNTDGVTERQWKTKTATPHKVDSLIKEPDDWLRYRDRLSFAPDRVAEGYADAVAAREHNDQWFAVVPGEPMWWALMAMGFERALPMLMDHPDVVEEMVAYQTRLNLEIIDHFTQLGKPDAMWHFSDLCYGNGMLFSPDQFRQIVLPHLKRITSACWDRDIVPMFHCCGKVTEFVPLLIESGYACAQPLEARDRNDVRELKPLYGDQITLFGNISVDHLSTALEQVDEEVEPKIRIAAKDGRYIFHSDHSVPPTVPLANFRRALELARKLGSYE